MVTYIYIYNMSPSPYMNRSSLATEQRVFSVSTWDSSDFEPKLQSCITRGLALGILPILVGGFNPFENISQNGGSSPSRGENEKYLKPPPSI